MSPSRTARRSRTIRGARDWLAVSGLKGDRVYHRKAALACGGTLWRHIAFEYPAEQKPMLDRVVERAAQVFDRLAEEACSGDLFTHPKSYELSAGATVASCWPDLFSSFGHEAALLHLLDEGAQILGARRACPWRSPSPGGFP